MAFVWEKSYPAGVEWGAPLPTYALPEILNQSKAKWGGRTALNFMGKTMTYDELHANVAKATKGFQDLGVGPGVQVALFLPNTPQYVISYFAILQAGGSVVNISPLDAEREIVHKVNDSEAQMIVTIGLNALYGTLAKGLPKMPNLKKVIVCTLQEALPFPKSFLFPLVKGKEIAKPPFGDGKHMAFKDLLATDGNYKPVDIGPLEDAMAVVQYTGGTTGLPKGAVLSHANLSSAVSQYNSAGGDQPLMEEGCEVVLVVLPLFHVFAMTVLMLTGLSNGAELVLHPKFDAVDVMKDIAKKKVTVFPGVPTMFMAIASHPEAKNYDLTSLKFCASGGAPLPVEVQARFQAVAKTSLLEGWGMTETSPSGTGTPRHRDPVPGSCGIPYPGIEIKIVDVDDVTKDMAPGETGEILIKGPNVTKGYWKKPEATADSFHDGYFRTGDTGYLNEDGYMFIVDRTKDMILSSGFNVYPRNIEEAIYEWDGVDEVTVIGIPDEYRGQSAKAFIKLKAGASEFTMDELKEFLKDKLAKYEIPTEVEFRAELPKTLVGKLTKKELVEEELAKRGMLDKKEA